MPAVGVAGLLVVFVPVLAAADGWPPPVDTMPAGMPATVLTTVINKLLLLAKRLRLL